MLCYTSDYIAQITQEALNAPPPPCGPLCSYINALWKTFADISPFADTSTVPSLAGGVVMSKQTEKKYKN